MQKNGNITSNPNKVRFSATHYYEYLLTIEGIRLGYDKSTSYEENEEEFDLAIAK